jgi:peptidoglycan DL-endopeptidase RipA
MRIIPRTLPARLGAAGAIAGVVATVAVLGASGADAAAGGTVHTRSGAPLTMRASATTGGRAVGSLSDGTRVTLSCQTYGSVVTGRYGTSNIWDKVSHQGHTGYVSDTYVYTGADGMVAKRCSSGGSTGGGGTGGGTGGTKPTSKVQAVIDAARSQLNHGYTYSWGGGGRTGPSYGICCSPSGYDDRHRFGYDCSGLTQYAFWQGAHIDIGTVSDTQYRAGKRIPYRQMRAGDLIFYGHGSSTTHVTIYLGNGRMIEAAPPRGSGSVHITAVRYGGIMPYVVRIVA